MYIGSFLKALFTPRKIWCSIYFLLNLVIVFFIFAAPGLLADAEAGQWVGMGFIGVGISMFFTFISLSPLGEAYVRYKERVKQLPRNEQTAWIYEIFDEVHASARKVNAKVSEKVKLYYKDTDEVNAYAVGHRTVIITDGILQLSPEQLKGVLAHEFGHISGGDSDIDLGINVSNTILMLFTIAVSAFISFMAWALSMAFESISAKATCIAIGGAITTALSLVYYLWIKLGRLMVNAASRNDEYAADAFSVKCGYGEGLHSALSTLDPSKMRSSFFSLLSSTHPDTVARLEKIRKKMNEMEAEKAKAQLPEQTAAPAEEAAAPAEAAAPVEEIAAPVEEVAATAEDIPPVSKSFDDTAE